MTSAHEGDPAEEALCFEDSAERELWLRLFEEAANPDLLTTESAADMADAMLAEVRKRSGPSRAERIVEMLRAEWRKAQALVDERAGRSGVAMMGEAYARLGELDSVRRKAEALLE